MSEARAARARRRASAQWRRIGRAKLVGVSLFTVLLFGIGVGVSGLGAAQLRANASRSRSQRLAESARLTANLFNTISQGMTALLATGGVVAETTAGTPAAFKSAIAPRLGTTLLSNAVLLDLAGPIPEERSWVGAFRPVLLQPASTSEQRLLRRAGATGRLIVVARGRRAGSDVIGIAAAATPHSRYVVYGELSVPRALSFGASSGIFAFYLGSEQQRNLLATNAPALPIRGRRLVVRLDTTGLAQAPILIYSDTHGLGFATLGPWLALGGGIALAFLIAVQFEQMRRRRDRALVQAAYNRHQALHDPLTGLPNRAFFHEQVAESISRPGRGKSPAVLLADLDRFKEVNDTLGHRSGDALLQALSRRLRQSVRAEDTVARLGGDEFGILIESCPSASHAVKIAEQIRDALRGPVDISGLSIEVDSSVGIALHPDHGDDVHTLIRHADIALYRSKDIHTPVIYTAQHDHYSPARLQLVSDLRHAIDDGQILVYYQPQAPAAEGPIHSVEALVRWQHPDLGLIPPDQFIPLAEQTGMIRPLTRYVLRTALAQCRTWLDNGHHIGVAVNVGARDLLDAHFPDEVTTCLEEADIHPEMLQLEITEDAIFTDFVRAYSVITRLHDRGVRFAVDDFGAGQTSLTYLKRLPIDILKIDKSFVIGMAEHSDDAAIVLSAIHLGQNLRLTVIAEGVETIETRERLATLGCDFIQGFQLSRAVPAAEVEQLFEPVGDTSEQQAA